MRRYLVLLIVPAIFLLDRWTKVLIIDNLAYLQSVDFTSYFSLVHARNYGGAFGFLAQHGLAKYIFTLLPLAIIGVLVYVILAYPMPAMKTIALTCILSGAIGNVYDRLVHGYVTDFLDFYYMSHHWPAFNVADISVSVGIGLWLLSEALGTFRARKGRSDGSRVTGQG